MDPEPHLGNSADPSGMGVSEHPDGMRAEQAHPLRPDALGELAGQCWRVNPGGEDERELEG